MADELSVNDIVTKAAESLTIKEPAGGDSSQTTQSQTQQQTAEVKNPENKVEAPPVVVEAVKETDKPIVVDALAELLKETGVSSVDELKTKLKGQQPKPELTPEEKAKQEEKYEADLQKYGVESGEMKLDDFHRLKTLKATPAQNLVYERYAAEQKEDDPELTEEEIKESFDSRYKLNSENAEAKKRGLARLEKEKEKMIAPLESSLHKVKGSFDSEQSVRATYPTYAKAVDKIVGEALPAKLDLYKGKDAEGDISLDIELSEAERKEILATVETQIKTPETFALFREGKTEQLKKIVQQTINQVLWERKKDEAILKVATEMQKRGETIGTKKGSEVGAKNPFGLKAEAKTDTKQTRPEKEQEIMDSLKGK